MTNQPPPPLPDDELHSLPCAPEAGRDLIGALIYDEVAFERAGLKSSDFYIHRWRWVWEACEAIRAADDHIDVPTIEKALCKSGHFEDVTAQHELNYYFDPNALLHVEANARLVREMAERRRMLAGAEALARRACDLTIPLPQLPGPDKTRWSQAELAAAEFPEPECPIPGLIPLGLTVLGGRPKRGKSYLILQAACALALGGKFLERDLQQGKVLYYIMEDFPRRLKDRTAKLGIPSHALIDYWKDLKPLHLGGMAEIEQAARHGNFKMIVIDTIRRAMPGKDPTKDGALYDDILGQLQTLAQQCRLAIVCILHTRKPGGGFDPDPVDDVLGSTGLTASADCVLALYTEQGKKGAVLKGRARDLEDIDLALQFDTVTCSWQSLGESGETRNMESEQEILDVLGELGKAQSRSIAKTIGKDFSNTHKRVAALWVAGKVKKEVIEGKAFYFLPNERKEPEVPTMPTTPTIID